MEKLAKLCEEKLMKNILIEKNNFLKSLNVAAHVAQLLCCPLQIEKLLSFLQYLSSAKSEKRKINWLQLSFWKCFKLKGEKMNLPIKKAKKIINLNVVGKNWKKNLFNFMFIPNLFLLICTLYGKV